MHDPMTVCWDIPNPLTLRMDWSGKWRCSPLLTIWHVDSERDGSDDSCGWFRPHLTKKHLARLESLVVGEAEKPLFRRARCKEISSDVQAEVLMRGLILVVADRLGLRFSWSEASVMAAEMVHNPFDNWRSSLCLLPGWHTNNTDDEPYWRTEMAKSLFYNVARTLLSRRRPWYRHPRWHIWHWRIQIHPLQHFKRWAFSRCSQCKKRFRWGEAVVTSNWHSAGPRWFRGETDVRHSTCSSGIAKATDAGDE